MSWEITGNAGTNESTNFLGTTDRQPLVIKTGGFEAMRIFFDDRGGGSVNIGSTQSGGSNLALGTDLQTRRSFLQVTNSVPNSPGQLLINPEGGQVLIGPPFLGQPSAALTVSPQGPNGLIEGIVIGRPDITSGGSTSLSLSISDISDGHALIQAIKSAGSEWGDLVLNLNGGNVGIGTTTTSAKLTVDPQGAGGIVIGNPNAVQGGFTNLLLDISAASGGYARLQAIKSSGLLGGRFSNVEYGDLALNPEGGNVGIGTISPEAKLEVSGSGYGIRAGGGDIGVFAHNLTTPTNVVYLATRGLAGDFHGDVSVLGNVSVAGDILLTGADCAEEFDIAEAVDIEPGTVMVLDQDGALHQSQKAYDKRVAGVISGAGDYKPSLILDRQQAQDNRMPVALVGKVYCKVDAQYTPIKIGDLLTTSPTPGHAMKADDPFKAFGSVIGKALRPLEAGQGMIPILIALQ